MPRVISILVGDVVGASADALVIPIDGSFVPAAGRIDRVLDGVGAQFARRYEIK